MYPSALIVIITGKVSRGESHKHLRNCTYRQLFQLRKSLAISKLHNMTCMSILKVHKRLFCAASSCSRTTCEGEFPGKSYYNLKGVALNLSSKRLPNEDHILIRTTVDYFSLCLSIMLIGYGLSKELKHCGRATS